MQRKNDRSDIKFCFSSNGHGHRCACINFAGAVVFALHAKDVSIPKRIIYMIVSILLGYLGAVMRHTGLQSHTLAAFGLSAVVVTIALASIDKIKAFDIASLLKKRG